MFVLLLAAVSRADDCGCRDWLGNASDRDVQLSGRVCLLGLGRGSRD